MYMDYFEEDPSIRTPPIPTVFLDPPGSKAGDHPLCILQTQKCLLGLCEAFSPAYLSHLNTNIVLTWKAFRCWHYDGF